MNLYFSISAPHRWAKVNRHGKTVDRGVAETLDVLPTNDKVSVIGVVPGEYVVTRKVNAPSRQKQKVMSALPYILEESLSGEIESLHVCLLKWKPGREVPAAVVSKLDIEQWLDDISAAGIRLDAMIPEYLLVPQHPQTRITVARTHSNRVCIRDGEYSGMLLDIDMLEYWWSELEDTAVALAINDSELAKKFIELDGSMVKEWDIGPDFTYWLQHHHGTIPDVNLLQGQYGQAHHNNTNRSVKIAVAMGISALVVNLGVGVAEYFLLSKETKELDQQISSTFKKAFPEVKNFRNGSSYEVRSQVKAEIEKLQSSNSATGDFQLLLAAAAKSVFATKAKLEEINYRDVKLTISCSTSDFAGLDRLAQQFKKDESIEVTLLSSGSRDNRVNGRFELQRKSS